MTGPDLSVVMPVYDEAAHLPATVDALVAAVERSGFERVELVLVDDGSTDGSAGVVEATLTGRLELRVVTQANRGRFEARRAGLEAAEAPWILLLDGRVRLDPESLRFVRPRIDRGERVWNGHVHVDTAGNPYGAFFDVLVKIAWRDYFGEPRTTSFGADDFDRYPKGTTCFLAPRDVLLEALSAFTTRYADRRLANDDTSLLRGIAARERIHLSPSFACDYKPRGSLRSFLRHGVHRGTVFLDGHGRRESRFFPVVVTFFPATAALAVAAVHRPSVVPVLGGASAAAAGLGAVAAGCPKREAISFAALTPVYALAHGAGMWRGLLVALRDGIARRL